MLTKIVLTGARGNLGHELRGPLAAMCRELVSTDIRIFPDIFLEIVRSLDDGNGAIFIHRDFPHGGVHVLFLLYVLLVFRFFRRVLLRVRLRFVWLVLGCEITLLSFWIYKFKFNT